MKLFGEFLVDKKLISIDQLLGALLVQLEEQPSLARLTMEHKLLNVSELLEVLKSQSKNKSTFLAAAASFSFWDPQKEERLMHYLSNAKTPLGEILIKNNSLDVGTLTNALDEYFGDKPAEEFGNSLQILPQSCLEKFALAVKSVSGEKLDDSTLLQSLVEMLAGIKSEATKQGMSSLFEFSSKLESGLNEILACKKDLINTDVVKKIKNYLTDAASVFRLLIENQKIGKIDPGFFEEGDSGKLVRSVIDGLALVEFDISHIEKQKD